LPEKPPVVAELTWQGELRFRAQSGQAIVDVDGDGRDALSPVQALAVALASCMATDVAHILARARLPFRALSARCVAERAAQDPHRFVRVDLRFIVEGDVPDDRVERAIALSRDTYCSVWHSLRQDIGFTTAFEVKRG
jgi:putative redox protein